MSLSNPFLYVTKPVGSYYSCNYVTAQNSRPIIIKNKTFQTFFEGGFIPKICFQTFLRLRDIENFLPQKSL